MKKVFTTLALAASMATVSPVYAQNQQDQQAKQGIRSVVGEVVETKTIQLNGVQGEHTLVKIQSAQGKSMVVNVGAGAEVKDVKKGDKIAATGKTARINGKPVLFAKYFGELNNAGRTGMKQ